MPFCRKCGFEYLSEDYYCNKCGAELKSIDFSNQDVARPTNINPASSNIKEIYIDKATLTGSTNTISKSEVNNTVVWILSLMPLIGLIIEIVVSVIYKLQFMSLWWITLLLNIVFFIIDYKIIVKVKPELFLLRTWIILIPVYLFKRAKAFNHSYSYFVTWLVLFVLLILLPFLI